MMFGNYNAYQPVGTPQQFAMDQMQQFQQRAQMQPGMQLIRVTGMDGAKAYQMPPNSVVPLFDADNDIMYVKSTDGAGFPTIRAFAFQPIENPTAFSRPLKFMALHRPASVTGSLAGPRLPKP
jgi:hypothetical protein